MGAQLVGLAFVAMQGTKVPASARVVLLRMAYTAKDADLTPLYWGGWKTLALALGYSEEDLEEAPGDADRTHPQARRLRTIKSHVQHQIRTLVDAGLVVRSKKVRAHATVNARYEVLPRRRIDPPGDDESTPHCATNRPPTVRRIDPPEEYQEEQGPEIGVINRIEVTSPARSTEDDDDEYPRARDRLLALPEAQQDRARAWALAEFPDATATRRAIEAARMLGVLA